VIGEYTGRAYSGRAGRHSSRLLAGGADVTTVGKDTRTVERAGILIIGKVLSGDVAGPSCPPPRQVIEAEAQAFERDLVGSGELALEDVEDERRSPVLG
jgi:hypothetical protein